MRRLASFLVVALLLLQVSHAGSTSQNNIIAFDEYVNSYFHAVEDVVTDKIILFDVRGITADMLQPNMLNEEFFRYYAAEHPDVDKSDIYRCAAQILWYGSHDEEMSFSLYQQAYECCGKDAEKRQELLDEALTMTAMKNEYLAINVADLHTADVEHGTLCDFSMVMDLTEKERDHITWIMDQYELLYAGNWSIFHKGHLTPVNPYTLDYFQLCIILTAESVNAGDFEKAEAIMKKYDRYFAKFDKDDVSFYIYNALGYGIKSLMSTGATQKKDLDLYRYSLAGLSDEEQLPIRDNILYINSKLTEGSEDRQSK